MQDRIEILKNECPKSDCTAQMRLMTSLEVEKAFAFHKSFPQYSETPLANLPAMADMMGIKNIYIKDESFRFGLHAFKVLGGSYAIAQHIAELTNCDVSDMTYDTLTSDELRERIGQVTFFTATDGNHGRGVAWAANKLGQKAVVYMPSGSAEARLANIQVEGAEATIIDGNYDDAVRLAASESAKLPGSVFVQDTAWEGYEKIPGWIMQGYGTMALETDRQLRDLGEKPTHIFVQAGVGSLAGAITGYYKDIYGDNCPKIVIVEARAADCLYRSALAQDYRTVSGEMRTIMAGLACGEPNTISWEILKNHVEYFASCPDWVAARGIRLLGNPLFGDTRVISGESGAVGMGLLAALTMYEEYADMRNELGLDSNSVVLLFNTEGNTDPQIYREVVWDGEYSSQTSSYHKVK